MLIYLSTIAGLATTLGSLIVLMQGDLSEKLLAALLGGAGGVMLAVVTLDLIPAAAGFGKPLQFLGGFSAGVLFMALAEKLLKGRRSGPGTGRRNRLKRMGLLIAAGIALHDIPEGMAIAVGQESAEQLGMMIALGIALHNLPEGMATTTPLVMAGINRKKILSLNLGIAFFTPLGAVLGKLALSAARNSLCFLLAAAAGAMAFLVLNGLLPLSRERHPGWAFLGGVTGFAFFLLLMQII